MAAPSGKLKVVSKDSRINYNLLPGEVLMTCPYIPSHAVLPIRFGKHVLNCHRLHCKEQQQKGEQPLFEICPHDRSHHVRKAEMAYHKSICEARVVPGQDDWGWDSEESGAGGASSSSSSGVGVSGLTTPFKLAPLQKVDKLDEATLAMIHEEDWESQPAHEKQFNAEMRIKELRKNGYSIIKYPEGLTKSERKEFYQKEEATMAAYAKVNFLERVRGENSTTKRNSTTVGSTTSEEPVMLPIPEEN